MRKETQMRIASRKPSATFGGTVGFITTAGESYIGMIFWGSPNASSMPSFPGYPAA